MVPGLITIGAMCTSTLHDYIRTHTQHLCTDCTWMVPRVLDYILHAYQCDNTPRSYDVHFDSIADSLSYECDANGGTYTANSACEEIYTLLYSGWFAAIYTQLAEYIHAYLYTATHGLPIRAELCSELTEWGDIFLVRITPTANDIIHSSESRQLQTGAVDGDHSCQWYA